MLTPAASVSLKALIKAIRATKTIADERALIVKESAVIRTSFKEEGESRALNGAEEERTTRGRVGTCTSRRSVGYARMADFAWRLCGWG